MCVSYTAASHSLQAAAVPLAAPVCRCAAVPLAAPRRLTRPCSRHGLALLSGFRWGCAHRIGVCYSERALAVHESKSDAEKKLGDLVRGTHSSRRSRLPSAGGHSLPLCQRVYRAHAVTRLCKQTNRRRYTLVLRQLCIKRPIRCGVL
jgi:hypothetical protein